MYSHPHLLVYGLAGPPASSPPSHTSPLPLSAELESCSVLAILGWLPSPSAAADLEPSPPHRNIRRLRAPSLETVATSDEPSPFPSLRNFQESRDPSLETAATSTLDDIPPPDIPRLLDDDDDDAIQHPRCQPNGLFLTIATPPGPTNVGPFYPALL